MVYTFSADFQKILSAHIETRDVYESDASIATWTASFDISNLPHDTYFGSPGVEGPLNFSRYNIDDNNGIRTNLKNFKYRVEYYWKSDQTTTTDQVVSIDLYNAPLFEKNYFWIWFRKT